MPATCPKCSAVLPEGALRCVQCKATEYPSVDGHLKDQLRDLTRTWSLHPFSSGWRKLNLGLTLAAMISFVYLAFKLNREAEDAALQARTQIDSHQKLIDETRTKRSLNDAERSDLVNSYAAAVSSVESLNTHAQLVSRIHIFAVLGFIALLGVSAVTTYRTHKELGKLRAGYQFLFTYEGGKVLDEVAPRGPERP